jgi:hypothetical protein
MKRFSRLSPLLCLLATACVTPRAALPPHPGDRTLPYPASFRAQHRITLTVGGRQVDFTGYLFVKQSTWRAMAFSEFGVSLFDMTASPGKGRRVVKTGGIPKAYLTGQAADIIEILFLPPQGGETGLGDGRWRVARNGAVYEIAYSDYAAFAGIQNKIPRHIVLEDKKKGLRLEADLLKFEPMEIPDRYFNE